MKAKSQMFSSLVGSLSICSKSYCLLVQESLIGSSLIATWLAVSIVPNNPWCPGLVLSLVRVVLPDRRDYHVGD